MPVLRLWWQYFFFLSYNINNLVQKRELEAKCFKAILWLQFVLNKHILLTIMNLNQT